MIKKEDYTKYYTNLIEIGRGGFAFIYEAEDKKTNKKKALKILDINLIKKYVREIIGKEPSEKDMMPYLTNFYNEFKYMEILQENGNENVVMLYEYFETKKEFVIVMELCDCNLFDYLCDKENECSSEEIYDILNQLNNSFEIMYKNQILHRALRPENILIKYINEDKNEFTVKLKLTEDCCLSKDLTNNTLTSLKILENCKIYAPEILEGNKYNEKSDLWSLGILIYFLKFREYPFKGKSKTDILKNIKENENELKKSNNPDLNDLIEKLLAIDPEKRITWEEYFNHSFFIENPRNDYNYFYEKFSIIGEGGFGHVHRCIKKNTGEERAIKIISKNKLIQTYEYIYGKTNEIRDNMNKDLKEEIKIMKIIEGKNKDNKNTVKLYEYFNMEKEFAIVMELCDMNLNEYFTKKNKTFSSQEIYELLVQLNNTFKIMKENHIIHRDLKLENILIKEENDQKIYKIIDYGSGKQLIRTLQTIKTNVGTYPFMAPEIIESDEELNKSKCDLWSLGIIIYYLFFSNYPYHGITPIALLNKIKNDRQKTLQSTKNHDLDDLIRKLLIINPDERISWDDYFNHPFFKSKK